MIQTDNIKQMSKALRLSTLSSRCEAILHQAQIESPSYQEFLELILTNEINQRKANEEKKRLKQAKLPKDCNLDNFDFNFSAGLTKPQMKLLRELHWIEQTYNVVLVGPSGTGKTYTAAGLVRDAALNGYRAYFITMENLMAIIRLKDLTPKALGQYNKLLKAHIIAIDDIMLMPIKKDEAVGFFNFINTLHGKCSIVITTNKTPTEWAETLEDEVLASALLDRLLFHCEVIRLSGNSYRMENRKTIFEQENI